MPTDAHARERRTIILYYPEPSECEVYYYYDDRQNRRSDNSDGVIRCQAENPPVCSRIPVTRRRLQSDCEDAKDSHSH